MNTVVITFELFSHGWARIAVKCGETSYEIDYASHTTDVFGDLVRSALNVVCEAWRTEVLFDGEPAEWRMICEGSQTSGETVNLRILIFDDLTQPTRPEAEGREVFSCQVDRIDYGIAIESATKELLDKHGLSGYDKMWGEGRMKFPSRALVALGAALSSVKQ